MIDIMDASRFWLTLAVIWSLPWKGVALWFAARNKQKIWFICILLINSLAVLEVTYLLFFQKDRNLKRAEGDNAKDQG